MSQVIRVEDGQPGKPLTARAENISWAPGPIFVLTCFWLAQLAFFFVFVVPRYQEIWEGLGGKLPFLTLLVSGMSWCVLYLWFMTPFLAVPILYLALRLDQGCRRLPDLVTLLGRIGLVFLGMCIISGLLVFAIYLPIFQIGQPALNF